MKKYVILFQSFSGDIEIERVGIDELFLQNRPINVRVEWYLMLRIFSTTLYVSSGLVLILNYALTSFLFRITARE